MKKLLTILIIFTALLLPVSCIAKGDVYFDVTFGGEYVEQFTVSVKEGNVASRPNDPTSEGRIFLYWATEDGNEYKFDNPVTADVALHAVWTTPEVRYFTVRFYGIDGKLFATKQVKDGGEAVVSTPSVDEFFVFDGWDKDITCVTCDLDVFARQRYDGLDASLFDFAENEDSTYSITGVKGELPKASGGYVKLALPTMYNGKPVTSISDGSNGLGVFSGKKILSAYIPSVYSRIGAYAFSDNPALMQVVFNEGLIEIGEGAFMATLKSGNTINGMYAHSGAAVYVSSLTEVVLPNSLEIIGQDAFNHIGGTVKNNNYVSQNVELKFGSGLKTIGARAFEGVMIYDIKLPKSLERIEEGAFAADRYINWVYVDSFDYPRSVTEKLTLPRSLRYIGDNAFYGLGNMSTFYNGVCITISTIVDLKADSLSLDYLGENAFYGASLKGNLSLDVKEVKSGAFFGQILSSIVLIGTERIGDYAFGRSSGKAPLTLILDDNLESIGEGAFYGNAGLTTVALPSMLNSIGDYAFAGCTELSGRLTLPRSLAELGTETFAFCGIEGIKIEGSVALGDRCFLSSEIVSIEGDIAAVGEGTFSGCQKLTSLTLPDMLAMPKDLFYGCASLTKIDLPTSLTIINDHAFYGCKSLNKIMLPSEVKVLSKSAFEGCSLLNDITFTSELETVDNSVFAYCQSLEGINLPDSVKTIGDYAFKGSGLKSFKAPVSLEKMGFGVFCQYVYVKTYPTLGGIDGDPGTGVRTSLPKLQSFIIGRESREIKFHPEGTFDGAVIERFEVEEGNKFYRADIGLFTADGKTLITYARDTSLSDVELFGVENIAPMAFLKNPFIYTVVLHDSLKTIGDYAFYGCERLRSVKLPSTLTFIGEAAFAGRQESLSVLSNIEFTNTEPLTISKYAFAFNGALRKVKLPALESIGVYAFYMAIELESVDFSESNLSGTGEYTFVNCASLENIDFGELKRVDTAAFAGCVGLKTLTLGEYIEEIASDAFRSCAGLQNIIVPDGSALKEIGAYAFAGTAAQNVNYSALDLSNATMLEEIGECAFAYGNVKSVILPSAPFTLGDEAFADCGSLSSVDFGYGVTFIGENVFARCFALKALSLPASILTISKNAFLGLKLTKVDMEVGKLAIGKNAFFDCKDLKEVNISGGVPTLVSKSDNMSFHCFDSKNMPRIIDGLTINIDSGMRSKFVGSGLNATGWEVYANILAERKG